MTGQLHIVIAIPPGIQLCASWMGGWPEPTTGFNRVDKTKGFVPSGNRTPTAQLQIMSYLECDWPTSVVATYIQVMLTAC